MTSHVNNTTVRSYIGLKASENVWYSLLYKFDLVQTADE